ncbi:MAG: hypothetical protein ABW036_03915 [Flavitalea sp.]
MLIRRPIVFLVLALCIIIPVSIKKISWIAGTKTTVGEMAFEGMGNALDQMRPTYSVIFFKHDGDTTWFDAQGNLSYKPGEPVPVRYSVTDPADAKVNTFIGIWAENLVYGGFPLLVLLAVFFHPHIFPYQQKLRIRKFKPFVSLES